MDDDLLNEFIRELALQTGDKISPRYVDRVDDVYSIDTDRFTLEFVADENYFEIRNIDVHGHTGFGRKIINAIHVYVHRNDYNEVIASNVRDTAIGFWQEMGYQEGSVEGEYFWLGAT